VRVACVGGVGTYEAHREQGLATQLMTLTCERAVADDTDFMLISGGRGLYRRAGAAEVGCDYTGAVSRESARRLHRAGVTIEDLAASDLAACKAAHEARPACFIRDAEEWAALYRSRTAQCRDVQFLAARTHGRFAGYFAVAETGQQGVGRLVEFAGEADAVAGALGPLMARFGWNGLELRLQAGDRVLRSRIEDAGAAFQPATHTGTLLLLRFTPLMERLRPHFQAQLGEQRAACLSFEQQGGLFVLADDHQTVAVERAQAARALFGHPEEPAPFGPDTALAAVFPLPTLCYGLSYV